MSNKMIYLLMLLAGIYLVWGPISLGGFLFVYGGLLFLLQCISDATED